MEKKTVLSRLLALALVAQSFAQQPAPRPSPPAQPPAEAGDEEIVRITTNLVQLDVVVTDKGGRQVTDLKAEDFDILEDGKPQKIMNFSYVSAVTAPSPAPPDVASSPAGAAAPPVPTRTRRENVHRAIAVVVDDLAMAADAFVPAREAIRKFVDQQVQEGDLVAVIRTGGEVGILQQFTSDRRLLYQAISRVRPSIRSIGGMSAFEPVARDAIAAAGGGGRSAPGSDDRPGSRGSADSNAGGALARDAASFQAGNVVVPLLRALGNVVNGMRELPGRKSLILFSPGFALYNPIYNPPDLPLIEARHLSNLANRAAVTLYTVDPRGLAYTGPTAADPMTGLSGRQIGDRMSDRSRILFETQGGTQFLADQTGGLAFKNSNDILPAARISEDLKGYYLIGYRPGGETFNRRFHKITARVRNRPDLEVRTRTGFFGLTEDEMRRAPYSSSDRLLLALMTPFAAQEIGVQLTPIFNNLPGAGSFLRSMLHIDAGALTFTPETGGWQRAEIVIHGVLFGDNGGVSDEHRRSYTVRLRGGALKSAQEHGLDYVFNMPAKKPGSYQFRVALLDSVSSHVGSAGQFVEVPELKKDRIALSGVIVNGVADTEGSPGAAARSAAQAQEGLVETQDPEATPAVRRFRQGMFLAYGYVVFNPRADKATGRPRLAAQPRLFRDGKLVFAGQETPIDTQTQPDPTRVAAAGRLQLGTDLPPGDYVLQITVTDSLAAPKRNTATQWIDFEIVK
ncbi:MAG TPA: VWA domain-containing protein [Pyrinomonadaceae bacterium]|nr:VWA domain-containing protein [Pyrinomonadaceae bacterium]